MGSITITYMRSGPTTYPDRDIRWQWEDPQPDDEPEYDPFDPTEPREDDEL